MSDKIMRLNWGCSFDRYEGWLGSDQDDYGQEHVGSILDGLPWEDETFGVVTSHHALQIITYTHMPRAISELYRVLVPGGVLRFSVPNPLGAFDALIAGNADYFPVADEIESTLGGKFTAYITWYSEARVLFTQSYGFRLLEEAGFRDRIITECGKTVWGPDDITLLDKRPNESLFFEAVK